MREGGRESEGEKGWWWCNLREEQNTEMKDERKDEWELQKVSGSEVLTQLTLQNDQALFCVYCMYLYVHYIVPATHLNNGSQSALLGNELSSKTQLPCTGRDQSSSPIHILAPATYKTRLHNFWAVIFGFIMASLSNVWNCVPDSTCNEVLTGMPDPQKQSGLLSAMQVALKRVESQCLYG